MSQSRPTQPDPPEAEQDAGLVHAPDWVTDALIADTIQTWQPYYESPLTRQDAVEMLVNVGRLFNLLEADHAQALSTRKQQT